MGLAVGGIEIVCEECRCYAVGEKHLIELHVPVRQESTGCKGMAVISCNLSQADHRVTLTSWISGDSTAALPLDDVESDLAAALRLVAERRLCGRASLCPADVARLAGQPS
jgi:hypothetical protein